MTRTSTAQDKDRCIDLKVVFHRTGIFLFVKQAKGGSHSQKNKTKKITLPLRTS
jgi:hypothetical protein